MKKLFSFLLALSLPFTAQAADCPVPEETPEEPIEIPETLEITALYPNPLEGEKEWIELHNIGTETLDLTLYTLEDATANPWAPSGNLSAQAKVQITGFSFQLNNGGDEVSLKTKDGTLLDQFVYTGSEAGQILTGEEPPEEEPETEDPEEEPTEDTPEEEEPETPLLLPIYSEALPNPEGTDTTEEWIELQNPTAETLDLTGLKIDDQEGGSSPHPLEGSMAPDSFLLISVEDSGIALNNTTDSVRLLSSTDEVLWEVTYSEVKEGLSYAFFEDHYEWTDQPTPGAPNLPPNSDPETEGEDGEPEPESDYQDGDLSEDLEISEILPNPEGPDTENEWVELTNLGDEPVNLGNWILDDGPEGSKPHRLPDDLVIEPQQTFILFRGVSKLALNNSNEKVVLQDFMGEIVDEIHFEKSVEGKSFSKIRVEEAVSKQASLTVLPTEGFFTWVWGTPTPGEENPKWLQIVGEVKDYDGQTLTLFDGLSDWTLQSAGEAVNDLMFQVGNQIKVQVSTVGGANVIMNSELLQNAPLKKTLNFPWGIALTVLGILTWGSVEFYKKKKSKKNIVLESEKSTL